MGIRYGFNYHTDENISNLASISDYRAHKRKSLLGGKNNEN